MDEATFLRLLLDEAPAAEFERVVTGAREEDPDPAVLEAVQEAGYLATQLRLVLQERRRREAELAALFATAGDLIAIRDPQRVLQAIVGRARQLLEADTAYLTLIDEERGDTWMRVTTGILTSEFRRVRLPLGVGLGGLVAETAMPWFTSDYLADERFDHAQDIDEAVVKEHLRAILGVPLSLAGKVIGVLFASNRHTRPFSPDQVNLLSSLAAHAAIVIENARLFDQATRALDQLSRTNEVVRAHSEAVERAAAIHDRLTEIVLRGGNLDDVVATVAEVLEASVALLDEEGRVVAVTSRGGGSTTDWSQLASFAEMARDRGTSHAGAEDGYWLTPVGAGGDHFGALVLQAPPDLGDADRRTLERAAHITALVLLSQRAIVDAELRMRGELLDDLLTSSERDLDVIRRRAHRLGVDVDRPQVMVVASAPTPNGHRAVHAAARDIVQAHGGLVADRQAMVVLMVGETSTTTVMALGERLSSTLGSAVTAGVARAETVFDVRGAFDEADRARRTLRALGREGEVATETSLGVLALLLNHIEGHDVRRFVEVAIGPLQAYDRDRGTDLVGTLRAWFASGGNMTRAAETLHVHVNTAYQRCARISELLGEGWQDPGEALRLHLALEIDRLRRNS